MKPPTLQEYAETLIQNRRTRDAQPLKPRAMGLYHALLVTLLPTAPTRGSHARALFPTIMRSASTGRRPLISDSPCKVKRPIAVHRSFEPKPATPQQIATIVEHMP